MEILGLNMITYSNRPFMASPACVFRTSTECRSRAASRRWELVDLATEHPQWVTSLVLMLGPGSDENPKTEKPEKPTVCT